MLKTLKRKIALVAVAGLGFGLVSTVPAFAAEADTAVANLSLAQVDSTLAVKNAAGADTAAARAGIQTIKITEGAAVDTAYHLAVTTAACNAADATMLAGMANLTGDAGTAIANAATVNTYTAGKIVVVTPTAGANTLTITTAALTAGTWNVCVDPNVASSFATGGFAIATITVVNAGAPASISWAQNTREISSTAVDYTVVATPKDASGVNTVLVGAETFVLDIAPQTGVSTSQVDLIDATISADDISATTGTSYDVTIDGNGDAAGAGFGSGSTVAGVTYTVTGQLVTSGVAVGAPSAATYTRVSNTSGLNATISFWNGNTSTATAVAALSSVPNQPAVASHLRVTDSTGARVKGATVSLALSGVTGSIRDNGNAADITSLVTGQDGFSTATFRPRGTAAGSGTVTASISVGASSLTATVPVTVTGFGATSVVASGVAISANNGNGFAAGATANVATASRTTTSLAVRVSGLDASKAFTATAGGTATTVKVNGTDAGTAIYPVADASGVATLTLTHGGATTGQTATIALDAAGDGTDVTVTVTFNDASATLTTVPATATTSFVAVSSTQDISATIADQFKNPITGGSFLLTNTSAPAGVTVQTAGSTNVSSTGTATLKATIGATAGLYVFTVQARDANGANVGSASTITFSATTDGAPGSVVLTAGGSEAGLGSFDVWVSPDGTPGGAAASTAYASTADAAAITAATGGWVVMTVSVRNAAGTGVGNVRVTAAGSTGVYISNAVTQAAAAIDTNTKLSTLADTSGVTDGTGVATFQVVPTRAGTNTVTFTVGSKTAVATFKAKTGIATTSIARDVKLSSSTVAVKGGEITQVTATVTDAWGNPVSGVALTGTVTGAAGRFAGGGRTFSANTDAAGTLVFELTANATEKGAGTLTVTGTDSANNNTNADFRTGDLSVNVATLGKADNNSATATLAVTEGTAAASPEIATVKADVKAVSDTVATLSKAVTTIQSSVTELTSSFSAQIKSLSSAIAKISRAIAALSKRIK